MKDFSVLLNPDVAWRLIQRYRWIIMIPLFFAIMAGIYLSIILPKVYEARTLILVEPQRVPIEYVRSIVSSDINERVSTISQQIMSRSNLERIINDFDLFQEKQNNKMYYEDKLESLRKNITVTTTNARRGANAFEISFKGQDPQKVVNIVNSLASYFIDENLRARESQAMGTSDFLKNELEAMRGQLETVEAAMKEFREKNMGELPEQLETTLSVIARYQEQLTIKENSLRDLELRLSEAERQYSEYKTKTEVSGDTKNGTTISALESELETLRLKYTDKHPEVIRLKKTIEVQKMNIGEPGFPNNRQKSESSQYQTVINQATLEIQKTKMQIKEIEDKIAAYHIRVDNIPKREQELLSLRRDYNNIQSVYSSLLNRKLEAEMSVNMERKQKGEQFRIIDTAKLPEKPISPNMKVLFLGALVVGFGIGLGGAFLMEYFDGSYLIESDIESDLNISVLATVPFVCSAKEAALAKINNITAVTFAVMILFSLSVLFLIYFIGPERALSYINQLTIALN